MMASCVKIDVGLYDPFVVSMAIATDPLNFSVSVASTSPSISVWADETFSADVFLIPSSRMHVSLFCDVAYSPYEVFNVIEGAFVLADGKKFYVLKESKKDELSE